MWWCEELEVGEGCNGLRVRLGGKVEGGWDGIGWDGMDSSYEARIVEGVIIRRAGNVLRARHDLGTDAVVTSRGRSYNVLGQPC